MTVADIPEDGKCYECEKPVDSDGFCFGCKEFICDDEECGGNVAFSLASSLGHGHSPEDHFVEADIDIDDEFDDLDDDDDDLGEEVEW